MKNEALNNLMKQLDVLADVKIYPIGTKLYRVLDNGDILMEKVGGHRIEVNEDQTVEFHHMAENNYHRISTPETMGGGGYGTRVVSWHFDRKAANKAAAPFLEAEKKKQIKRNNDRIAELQGENMKLEFGEKATS